MTKPDKQESTTEIKEDELVIVFETLTSDYSYRTFNFELNLTDKVKCISANFTGSIFEKKVNFSGLQIKGKAPFQSCTFKEGANFDKVEFEEEAIFKNAKFYGETSFEDTNFLRLANFEGAQFANPDDEDSKNFEYKFKNTSIRDDANFKEAEFHGKLNFSDVRFYRDANFELVLLIGEIKFNSCILEGITSFSGTNFRLSVLYKKYKDNKMGNISFNQCAIQGNINFNNSFFGSFEFSETTFPDNIKFPLPENIKTGPSRLYYCLIKHQKLQEHDQVLALKYYSLEMGKYAKEINKEKHNKGEKILLFFSSLTNYGLDWTKGIAIFALMALCISFDITFWQVLPLKLINVISIAILFIIFFILILLKYWKPIIAYFAIIIAFILVLHLLDKDFGYAFLHDYISNFLYLINPKALWGEELKSFPPKLDSDFAYRVITDLLRIFWTAFYGAMTWQIIVAFRKYSRSLE